jgi:hypothetical protein
LENLAGSTHVKTCLNCKTALSDVNDNTVNSLLTSMQRTSVFSGIAGKEKPLLKQGPLPKLTAYEKIELSNFYTPLFKLTKRFVNPFTYL